MDIGTVSLKDYSSLRVGGEGKLVVARTVEELKEALMYAKAEDLRVHLLGGGTNSYFGENLSDFLFIKLELFGKTTDNRQQTTDDSTVFVTAYATEMWDDVVKYAVEQGLWGLENLSLIPGTVGAAPVQNIGAYGVELKEVFISLQALDVDTFEVKTFDKEMCRFGYRDSIFKYEKGKYIITEVTLQLSKKPTPVLLYKPLDSLSIDGLTPQTVRDMVIATRTAKLPDWQEHPNAGSFFKNPIVDLEVSEHLKTIHPDVPVIQTPEGYKVPAGWLIEHVAGMRGVLRGDVGTWPNQSLVLVNYGAGTADDIDALAREIRETINAKTGIVLQQEVNRVG